MPSSQHYDVVVVGVGTMGSMAAWRLAERNLRVLGIERYDIGHERGAAGGETRIFRTAYKEGRQYIPLLRHGARLWSDLQARTEQTLITRTGALTIGAPDHPEVREVLDGGREYGLELEVLDTTDAQARFPQHRFFDGDIAVLDPSGGVIRPSAAVRAAVDAAVSRGAEVRAGVRVRNVLAENNRVRVVLDDGEVTADRAIVSLGPWTRNLLPEVGRRFEIRRSVLSWLPVTEPGRFAPDRFPVGLRRSGPGRDLSFFPSMDGRTIKVNLHITKQVVEDPEDFDGTIPEAYSRDVGSRVGSLIDGVEPHGVRSAGFMEGYSPDNHGLVGEVPGLPRVFALAGFSGHGFKLSPAIGDVAADLVLDGATAHDVAHLRLSRPADHQRPQAVASSRSES